MLRCYIAEVRAPHRNDGKLFTHQFFARISRDGKVKRPTESRGPTVFASHDEARTHIERAESYREKTARFQRWEDVPPWEFRIIPIFVPVRTAIFRQSFEIPLSGL